MTKRRRISTRDRVALFQSEQGVCHHCGGLVYPGQAWELSHKIPLALGGADDGTNWGVIHKRPCHEEVTRTIDVPAIAKAKRREAAHLGISKPSTLQSRGFAKPDRQPKRLSPSKQMSLPSAIERRMGLKGDAK